MNVEITAEKLRKVKEPMRFKLWWGLVNVLGPKEIQALNRELGASFFPPDKIVWLQTSSDSK